MQKASLDFRNLFLATRGYMQRSFHKLSSKCRFFLDLWHVCPEPQNYVFDASELILHINLGAMTSHKTSRSLRHIHLNYFWVSHLYLFLAAFLSPFVFFLVRVLSAWFLWTLVIICMHVSLYKHHFSFHLHLTIVACITLFFTNCHRFSYSFHRHACFSIFQILHSMFACMIIYSWSHLVSPCVHIFIFFHWLVGWFGQPWLGLCLAQIALHNFEREGFAFLPENAQI